MWLIKDGEDPYLQCFSNKALKDVLMGVFGYSKNEAESTLDCFYSRYAPKSVIISSRFGFSITRLHALIYQEE